MNRYTYLTLILLLVAACGKTEKEPLNIVVLVADALPADHLGFYGSEAPTSPNLDALALESAVFDDYHTVVPATLPSFLSLFTSRHPKDHGVPWNGGKPLEGLDTLGLAFGKAGYETAFFISSYCLASEFGTRRGFDLFEDRLVESVGLPSNKLIRNAADVSRAFLDWDQRRDRSKPCFAVVHYFDPHWPYQPPEAFARIFIDKDRDDLVASFPQIRKEREALEKSAGQPGEKAKHFRNLHLAEIRYMDHEIGKIIDTLKNRGNTLLVFTADHGETFWEHDDYFNHGLSVYNTNTRLPLLVWSPGLVEPGRRPAPCFSNIDLGPSLLSLIDAPVPQGFTGRPVPLLSAARDLEERPVYAEATKPHQVEKPGERSNLRKAKSVTMGPWKYIWTPWKEGMDELYLRHEDPMERNDLAADPGHERLMAQLKESLKAWAAEYEGVEGRENLSPEVLEKLEKLGYGK